MSKNSKENDSLLNSDSELLGAKESYISDILNDIAENNASLINDIIENEFGLPDFFTQVFDPPEDGDDGSGEDITPPIEEVKPPEDDVVAPPPPEEDGDTPATFRIIDRNNRMEGDAEDSGIHNVSLVDVDTVLEYYEYENAAPAGGWKYHEIPVTFRVHDPDVTGFQYEEMLEFNFHKIGYQQDIEFVGLEGYNVNPGDVAAFQVAVLKSGLDPLNTIKTYDNLDATQKDLNLMIRDDLLEHINSLDHEVILRVKFIASDSYDNQTVSQEFSIIFNGDAQSVVDEVNTRQDVDDIILDDVDMYKAHPDYGSNGNWPDSNSGGSIDVIIEEGSNGGSGTVELEDGENGEIIFTGDDEEKSVSENDNLETSSDRDVQTEGRDDADLSLLDLMDRDVGYDRDDFSGSLQDFVDIAANNQEVRDAIQDAIDESDVFSFENGNVDVQTLMDYSETNCATVSCGDNVLDHGDYAVVESMFDVILQSYGDMDDLGLL